MRFMIKPSCRLAAIAGLLILSGFARAENYNRTYQGCCGYDPCHRDAVCLYVHHQSHLGVPHRTDRGRG